MAALPTDDVEWLLQAIQKAVSAGVKEALSQLQVVQPGQPGQPLRVFLPGPQQVAATVGSSSSSSLSSLSSSASPPSSTTHPPPQHHQQQKAQQQQHQHYNHHHPHQQHHLLQEEPSQQQQTASQPGGASNRTGCGGGGGGVSGTGASSSTGGGGVGAAAGGIVVNAATASSSSSTTSSSIVSLHQQHQLQQQQQQQYSPSSVTAVSSSSSVSSLTTCAVAAAAAAAAAASGANHNNHSILNNSTSNNNTNNNTNSNNTTNTGTPPSVLNALNSHLSSRHVQHHQTVASARALAAAALLTPQLRQQQQLQQLQHAHSQAPPAHLTVSTTTTRDREYDSYAGLPHAATYGSGVSSVQSAAGLPSASPNSVCSDGSPPPLQIEMDQQQSMTSDLQDLHSEWSVMDEQNVSASHPYLVKPRRRSRWILSDNSPVATRICVLDIVCLLPSTSTWIPIPRGDTRKMLADSGLIKKLQITSTSTEEELKHMISNLFSVSFNLAEDELLPYDYLRTQPSCKRLVRPEVTEDWHWGGREVANLAGQGCLYIVSKIPLSLDSKAPLKSIVQEVQRQAAAAAAVTATSIVSTLATTTSMTTGISLPVDGQTASLSQVHSAAAPLTATAQTHALAPLTDSRTRMRICTKEIVCLLPTCITSIPIPRRYTRRILAEKGLVQKIRIATYWTEEQIKTEISSLFRKPYGLQQGEILPFDYLCTKPNCKRLVRASASDSVQWGGQEVARLAGQGCLYIVSRIPLYTNTMLRIVSKSPSPSPTPYSLTVNNYYDDNNHDDSEDDEGSAGAGGGTGVGVGVCDEDDGDDDKDFLHMRLYPVF